MDPDEQNFKEYISLFIYHFVLMVLHKKYQIRNKTLSFRRKRNRGRKTENPLYRKATSSPWHVAFLKLHDDNKQSPHHPRLDDL